MSGSGMVPLAECFKLLTMELTDLIGARSQFVSIMSWMRELRQSPSAFEPLHFETGRPLITNASELSFRAVTPTQYRDACNVCHMVTKTSVNACSE